MTLTRLFATLAVAALMITGCGSADTEVDEETATTGAFPATVVTESGDVVIDVEPERIVTLGNPAFENVTALGFTPVAAALSNAEGLPYLSEYATSEAIDDELADAYSGTINFEKIATYRPDLIVAPSWPAFTDPSVLSNLREIAPTLVFDTQDAQTDWRVGVDQVATGLGKSEKGRELVDEAVAAFAASGEAYPTLSERPYSFGLYMSDRIALGSGGNILRLLGMTPAEDQVTVEASGTSITYAGETIPDVDGDVVILMPFPQEAASALEQSPFWANGLDARVVWLSDAQGEAINNAGILGKTWLAQNFEQTLGQIDG